MVTIATCCPVGDNVVQDKFDRTCTPLILQISLFEQLIFIGYAICPCWPTWHSSSKIAITKVSNS